MLRPHFLTLEYTHRSPSRLLQCRCLHSLLPCRILEESLHSQRGPVTLGCIQCLKPYQLPSRTRKPTGIPPIHLKSGFESQAPGRGTSRFLLLVGQWQYHIREYSWQILPMTSSFRYIISKPASKAAGAQDTNSVIPLDMPCCTFPNRPPGSR